MPGLGGTGDVDVAVMAAPVHDGGRGVDAVAFENLVPANEALAVRAEEGVHVRGEP